MQAHELRVVEELDQLKDRTRKLELFVSGNQFFSKLPADEQSRLRKQLGIMSQYVEVLEDRINNFPVAV